MSKVWFITGSARGLGRAITEAALRAGHSVFATARKPEQLKDLVDTSGERILPRALDVTLNARVLAAVQAGHEKFGRIDVVVNNTGNGDTATVDGPGLGGARHPHQWTQARRDRNADDQLRRRG